MIPPARGRGIIVILISFIGFAILGRLNVVAVAVIGRGRGSPGARKKSIADHLGRATPAGHGR
jgi:hypothetical protein